MHHPEDFLFVHVKINSQSSVSICRIGFKVFFNGVFDHQIPEEHPVSMVDIFVINVHTTGNQFLLVLILMTSIFSLSLTPV